MKHSLGKHLAVALPLTLGAGLLLAPPAHADVTDVTISCSGASGRSGSFVTSVYAEAGGRSIGADDTPTPTWSIGWTLEGDHVVTLWDRTAGNDRDAKHGDTSHGGPGSNVVGTYKVSCPVATTTTVVETTTTTVPPTTEAPSTTSAPQPTVTVEPTTTETTVELTLPPVPSTTTPKPQRVETTTTEAPAPSTTMPVPELVVDSTLVPPTTVAPTTSTDGAIDRAVPTTTAALSIRTDRLPATGSDLWKPLVALGFVSLVAGIAARRVRRNNRPFTPRP